MCIRDRNSTELFCKKAKETLDDYIQYGKKNQAETLLYLQEDGEIEMINLKTGERKASGKKEEMCIRDSLYPVLQHRSVHRKTSD